MSKFGNKLIKNVLQINSNEFTTSYRGFNLSKLKNFHLNQVSNKGYSFFMGTLFEIDKLGYKIKEIPIIFKDRQKGFSKIPTSYEKIKQNLSKFYESEDFRLGTSNQYLENIKLKAKKYAQMMQNK